MKEKREYLVYDERAWDDTDDALVMVACDSLDEAKGYVREHFPGSLVFSYKSVDDILVDEQFEWSEDEEGERKMMRKEFSIHTVKPGDTFPIKVQISLNAGSDSTMVYSKDRVPLMLAGNYLPRSLGESVLGDREKGYFNAHFTEDGQLSVDCNIPDQKW